MATQEGRTQPLNALQRANEVRLARAELKRRLKRGEVTAAEVISDVPWEAASMAVGDLLDAQRRWGRQRVVKLCGAVPVPEGKPVGELTERQRRVLLAKLAGRR